MRAPLHLLLGLTLIGPLACEDDTVNTMRPDSGAPDLDGGVAGPLALEPGMTFTYQGRLTARGAGQGDEKSSVYTLTVTIDSVEDRGADAPSSLTYSATGSNQLNQDWTDVYDFSSWVARLGPALRTDAVGSAPVTVDLTSVPSLPPRQTPKQLPTGSFFLDMRRIADIRTRFTQVYEGSRPQVVDPSQNNGAWLFEIDGEDPDIITYEVPRRNVRIEYDERGFITRLDETLSEPGQPPTGSHTLVLQQGPDDE